MARERYLVHVSEEDLKPAEEIGAPKTPKGKWENFWYHYKIPACLAAFTLVAAVLLTVQYLTKEKYDYTVTVVSDQMIAPTTLDLMKAELAPFATDVDGNGKVSILVDNIALAANGMEDPYAGHQKLMTVIGAGDFMLFAVEKDVYEADLKELLEADEDFFRPLTTTDGGLTDRWVWNAENALSDADLMQVWYTEDFVWFVRAATGLAAGEKYEAVSDAHHQLLQTYIEAYEAS